MKHANVAIFIPHNGCPHMCSFCNQREITGQQYQPTARDVKNTLSKAVRDLGEKAKNTEIAFFGGSFTAIDRNYMLSLLNATTEFIDKFKGIRLSTRPDYIDDEVLILLKKYNTTTIELGAQSMSDLVLRENNRGHSAQDVINASRLIKSYGINLGLQMMTGLYKSNPESDYYTAEQFALLKPDCVRIYPTIIMKNTKLERLYYSGEYTPYTLSQSVKLCSKIMLLFEENSIDVIRVGLHYSESLVQGDVAGLYHPAFKELCESQIMLENALSQLGEEKNVTLSVNPRSVSKMTGQNKANLKKLAEFGYQAKIIKDDSLEKYEVKVNYAAKIS